MFIRCSSLVRERERHISFKSFIKYIDGDDALTKIERRDYKLN